MQCPPDSVRLQGFSFFKSARRHVCGLKTERQTNERLENRKRAAIKGAASSNCRSFSILYYCRTHNALAPCPRFGAVLPALLFSCRARARQRNIPNFTRFCAPSVFSYDCFETTERLLLASWDKTLQISSKANAIGYCVTSPVFSKTDFSRRRNTRNIFA